MDIPSSIWKFPSGTGCRYRQYENLKETKTMPSRRVAADLNTGTYYLTLTIQRWYYLFDRHNRWQMADFG